MQTSHDVSLWLQTSRGGIGYLHSTTSTFFVVYVLTDTYSLHLTVPFLEQETNPPVWYLDHDYVDQMRGMFKKVNAKEKLIGWYHSGPKLRSSDMAINELFKRYTPDPLLVIIDVEPKDVGIPTDAYFAVEEIRDVSPPVNTLSLYCLCLLIVHYLGRYRCCIHLCSYSIDH